MPKLEAQAGAEQARLWSFLLKALAKIGNELFIEVNDQQLVLRTLNSARSAFVTSKFEPSYFDKFDATKDAVRCKVFLKPFVAVFKNLNNVQSFQIRCDSDESALSIDFNSKDGVNKQFRLVYEACDVLQAVYSKDDCGSHAVMPSGPLNECLSNFHTGVEEVTLAATKSALRLGTYVDPASTNTTAASLHTEMSFNAQEFERFEMEEASSVTFAIRELKAVASFLESLHLPVSINFDKPGSPIIFGAEMDSSGFQLDLVLSTIQPDALGHADDIASCVGGADSWSSASQRTHDQAAKSAKNSSAVRGKGVKRTAMGSGRPIVGHQATITSPRESIVTADTTPPSAHRHRDAGEAASQASLATSVPATEYPGRHREVAAASVAQHRRSVRNEDSDDAAEVAEEYQSSQMSYLSVPATERLSSISPPSSLRQTHGTSREREVAAHRHPSAKDLSSSRHGLAGRKGIESPGAAHQSFDPKRARMVERGGAVGGGEDVFRRPTGFGGGRARDDLRPLAADGGTAGSRDAVAEAVEEVADSCGEEDEFVEATPSPPAAARTR